MMLSTISDASRLRTSGLIKLLLSLPSNWGDVFDTSKLKVVHLSGAMTNVVYRITWPKNGSENDDRTVLVRVYGKGRIYSLIGQMKLRRSKPSRVMDMARFLLDSLRKACGGFYSC
nr:probable choline kinase 1 [Tanacetum cinerariifolium]